MKLAFILLISASFTNSFPSNNNQHRRYYPEEDDPYRFSSLILEDENGVLHFQNLLQEPRSETFTKSEVNFHLYTRNNELDSELIPGLDFENLMSSNYFNATKNTTFIIHGWNNNYKSPLNTLIKPVLLRHYDINVFVVDWSGPANKFYSTSVSVVPIVGEFVGSFVNFIIDYFGCTPDQFSFVGHSLGAHVSGKAGKVVKEYYGPVDFIVGLDPASPLFTVKDTEKRLDTSDANFVHIIHTNGGKLGFKSSIGHADYFPNGGSSQPGCGLDIFGTCAHSRAYEYFSESIKISGFKAHLCDDIESYDDGRCLKNHVSYLGQYEVDKEAAGDYFLKTSQKEPFALGDGNIN